MPSQKNDLFFITRKLIDIEYLESHFSPTFENFGFFWFYYFIINHTILFIFPHIFLSNSC